MRDTAVSDGSDKDTLTVGRLRSQLADHFGFSPGTPLKLAYSGGLDSEVLLHLLAALQDHDGWRVSAVHVHHGLSANADAWAEHCAHRCRALSVAYAIERVAVTSVAQEGPEAAARRARYAALARHVGQGEVLLTAQHRRDQAETMLLRLLRGAGCHGMAAMVDCVPFGAGWLARPLLDVEHGAIEDYARAHHLSWIEDEMNTDLRLARGFLRARIMPVLRGFWPQADRQLARAATHAAEAAELLDEIAEADLAACAGTADDCLSIAALRRLSVARQKNVLRLWFVRAGHARPSMQHLRQVLQVMERPSRTARAVVREGDVEVRRYRDRLSLEPVRAEAPPTDWSAHWNPCEPLPLPGRGEVLRAIPDTGRGLSVARVAEGPLEVRYRRGGEVCRLAGRHHRRKVKKLLQEAGVPPWERARMPLVYVGGELAAIGERWVCEPFDAAPGEPALRVVIERTGR